METPTTFDGIFYSEDSGSEAIFGLRGGFIDLIKDRPDGLFLALGAIVDTRINGYVELSQELYAKAKEVWVTADWSAHDVMLATIDALASPRTRDGDHRIFEVVKQAAMPKTHILPAGFTPYFYDLPIYNLVYSTHGAVFAHAIQGGSDYCDGVKMIVGVYLNGDQALVDELIEALPHFWSQTDADGVRGLFLVAQAIRQNGKPNWVAELEAAIELTIQGFTTVEGFAPPPRELPDSFKHYFVPRSIVRNVYAGPVQAITMLRGMGIPLNKIVQIFIVADLNGDKRFKEEIQVAIGRLYPQANMARLRTLCDDVRKTKETLGSLWMSFAMAQIDLAINGHADITWVEGAA